MERGDDPMQIIDDSQAGMREVGERYSQQTYYLSGLIIAAYSSMRETVIALRAMMDEDGTHIPILLGGQVDEQVCRYVGADRWTTDAMEGVRLCQKLVSQS